MLRSLFLMGVLASLLMPAWAFAGSFTVTPVRVFLTPKDRVVAMTVVNEADERLVLQTELVAWSQSVDGQDQLEETDDLIVAPPIIAVPPKGRQVVRLAVTQTLGTTRQRTYRLFVREIVENNTRPKDNEVAIPIALTLSLPVFITPAGAQRQVDCSLGPAAQALKVTCANNGRAYAQLRRLVVLADGHELASLDGAVYVLPGAQRELTLKPQGAVPAGPLKLKVTYDDDQEQVFDGTAR